MHVVLISTSEIHFVNGCTETECSMIGETRGCCGRKEVLPVYPAQLCLKLCTHKTLTMVQRAQSSQCHTQVFLLFLVPYVGSHFRCSHLVLVFQSVLAHLLSS